MRFDVSKLGSICSQYAFECFFFIRPKIVGHIDWIKKSLFQQNYGQAVGNLKLLSSLIFVPKMAAVIFNLTTVVNGYVTVNSNISVINLIRCIKCMYFPVQIEATNLGGDPTTNIMI